MPRTRKTTVAVLYNHVGEDEYEKIRTIDPNTLDFTPEYNIHVSTITEEYQALAKALTKAGYRTKVVNIEENIGTLHSLLYKNPPDVVFNLIEFFRDEPKLEYLIAGMFDLYGIPYTGAPPFSLALCQRKGLTKQLLLAYGVPTPHYKLLNEPKIARRHGLKYPLIVKPSREDASSGVEKSSVVHDMDSLTKQLERTFAEFSPPIMVEEFIEGRELHVSVLGNNPPVILPIIEFDFSELPPDYPRIISYDAKWNPLNEAFHRVHSICPAKLSRRTEKKVRDAALRAYKITSCRDYARLDIRLTKDNKVYVLEVNPNPDLTEGVSFMESAEKMGLSFQETLVQIVEFALARRPVVTRKPST